MSKEVEHIPQSRLIWLAVTNKLETTTAESDHLQKCLTCFDQFQYYFETARSNDSEWHDA